MDIKLVEYYLINLYIPDNWNKDKNKIKKKSWIKDTTKTKIVSPYRFLKEII